MKKIVLGFALLLISSHWLTSQELFEYTENGLNTHYVVSKVDSLDQKELFKKTINWIKESYHSPDDVINTTIDNEKVRFTGVTDNALCHYGMGTKFCKKGRYVVEIAFKDGRYKFEVFSLEVWSNSTQYTSAGWSEVPLYNVSENIRSNMFKKNGRLRKMFRDYPQNISGLFNAMNLSLLNYLSNNQSVKDEKDW